MKDLVNIYACEDAIFDDGSAQVKAGPGLGIWLLPMTVAGGAVWIVALAFLLG
ncbi:hypothetical protein [Paragemmobacter aquarius]|uniref:hypothetical protein n=1 Tax=Paragemmobacter aquarius TaxID=2169400 RepID=UPI00131EF0DF|nr:hypothetical protein [Gemmobacter aquarius]